MLVLISQALQQFFKRTANTCMLLVIDFCIDYGTYLCWQVSSILFSIIISSFDFNLLKYLWSEICFCLVLKFTLSNTRFQSWRHLALKVMILQAFKVEHFASQKWSEEWVELIQKYHGKFALNCWFPLLKRCWNAE